MSFGTAPFSAKETRIKVPPTVFDLVYRLMLKRIAAGYSREELDFFLGFESPYWERIENLWRYGYLTLGDILLLCDLFNCSATEFKPPAYITRDRNSFMHISIKERHEQGKILYEIYQLEAAQRVLLYKLEENDPESYSVAEGIREQEEARAIIHQLFESTFFDEPRDALQIFRECRSWLENVKPRFIHSALQHYLHMQQDKLKQTSGSKYDAMALAYQRIHQKKEK